MSCIQYNYTLNTLFYVRFVINRPVRKRNPGNVCCRRDIGLDSKAGTYINMFILCHTKPSSMSSSGKGKCHNEATWKGTKQKNVTKKQRSVLPPPKETKQRNVTKNQVTFSPRTRGRRNEIQQRNKVQVPPCEGVRSGEIPRSGKMSQRIRFSPRPRRRTNEISQ